ncbi:hypothetical protein KP509_1Z061900 [Ceratopteris richardii]|nr:hypothetical protein KP509_1Z061900 [Ceratopteris richardii]
MERGLKRRGTEGKRHTCSGGTGPSLAFFLTIDVPNSSLSRLVLPEGFSILLERGLSFSVWGGGGGGLCVFSVLSCFHPRKIGITRVLMHVLKRQLRISRSRLSS